MIAVPRLLAWLLPLLMAAALAVAPAKAHDGQAALNAVAISLNAQPINIHSSVDHSSKWPRTRASLEEFFELDDDAEQNFKRLLVLLPDPIPGVVLRPTSQACFPPEADLPWRRPCAAYPTGPPHA